MIKIIQKHNDCIGCGACVAVCPDFWEFGGDGKVKPKNGQFNKRTGEYGFEIAEKDLVCNKEAEEICPVHVIKLVN